MAGGSGGWGCSVVTRVGRGRQGRDMRAVGFDGGKLFVVTSRAGGSASTSRAVSDIGLSWSCRQGSCWCSCVTNQCRRKGGWDQGEWAVGIKVSLLLDVGRTTGPRRAIIIG
jgi:hypothetical protein